MIFTVQLTQIQITYSYQNNNEGADIGFSGYKANPDEKFKTQRKCTETRCQ